MSGREGLLLNGEQDQVPLGEIVQLSQIRGDRNRVTTSLKDSILQEGLLYPPIVASLLLLYWRSISTLLIVRGAVMRSLITLLIGCAQMAITILW